MLADPHAVVAKHGCYIVSVCPTALCYDGALDDENMDWSPQTNYHMTYCKSLDTPNLAKSSLSVMSLGDRQIRALIFVYIIEDVAHAHVQNTPLERFLSILGLGVMSRLLSEICWLRVQ